MIAILLKFFGNPKFLIGLAIVAVLGGAYYKYHSLQINLEEANIALKQEQDNNVVLRGNIETITQVNAANSQILKQQAIDSKTTVETITKLSNDLKKSGRSYTDLHAKIESIKDKPVPLTPYLKEAIIGIQAERNLTNVPLVSAPVVSTPVVPVSVEPTKPVVKPTAQSSASLPSLTSLTPLPPLVRQQMKKDALK
jgi:hypothetical protein